MRSAVTIWGRWCASIIVGTALIVPAVQPAPANAQTPVVSAKKLDLTGNGIIDDTDMEMAINAWSGVQEIDGCTTSGFATLDLNNSGCIDVADVQLVASRWGEPADPARPKTEAGAMQAASVFTVNSTGDEPDAVPGDGVCATASATCTLRAAIQEANNHGGADTIGFDIRNSDGSCPDIVRLEPDNSPTNPMVLDDKTGGTTIDGYTQCNSSPNTKALVGTNAGNDAQIRIEIKNTKALADSYRAVGLQLSSPGNVVRGLAIYNWDYQILLRGSAATANRVEGNFIGTNIQNDFKQATRPSEEIKLEALRFEIGASDNVVGGSTPDKRNVIGGSSGDQVDFEFNVNRNRVIGNYIGLKKDGRTRFGNGGDGVDLNGSTLDIGEDGIGPQENVIGGLNPGEGNVIGGNGSKGDGVEFSHSISHTNKFNQALGNYIGINAFGDDRAYNGRNGVTLEDSVEDAVIYGNIIGGNGANGIRLFGLSKNVRVEANKIGVGPNGVTSYPNGWKTDDPEYQGGNGVYITGGGQYNLVTNNTIANNVEAGVGLTNALASYIGSGTGYADAYYNTISRNSIYNNGGKGIYLSPNNPDPAHTIPNEGLPAPTLTSANANRVVGTARLRSGAPCANCLIELFISDGSDSAGEGKTFITDERTDANGNFTIESCSLAKQGQEVTSTSTDTSGNTSEFSQNVTVGAATGACAVAPHVWIPFVRR